MERKERGPPRKRSLSTVKEDLPLTNYEGREMAVETDGKGWSKSLLLEKDHDSFK